MDTILCTEMILTSVRDNTDLSIYLIRAGFNNQWFTISVMISCIVFKTTTDVCVDSQL